MTPTPAADFEAILEELLAREVDFIVIGGVGAVLQGAPIFTFDLDIVHSRAAANLPRLLDALRALDAFYRQHAQSRPAPILADLGRPGAHLLMTRIGPLDLLGEVTGGQGYEELLGRSKTLVLGSGRKVHVLDLAAIIEIKTRTGREKDLAVLPVLRRTIEERDRT